MWKIEKKSLNFITGFPFFFGNLNCFIILEMCIDLIRLLGHSYRLKQFFPAFFHGLLTPIFLTLEFCAIIYASLVMLKAGVGEKPKTGPQPKMAQPNLAQQKCSKFISQEDQEILFFKVCPNFFISLIIRFFF